MLVATRSSALCSLCEAGESAEERQVYSGLVSEYLVFMFLVYCRKTLKEGLSSKNLHQGLKHREICVIMLRLYWSGPLEKLVWHCFFKLYFCAAFVVWCVLEKVKSVIYSVLTNELVELFSNYSLRCLLVQAFDPPLDFYLTTIVQFHPPT